MRYRAHIDGLRAIAVLSVVLFHAGLRFFPGGFVGVDVFFVISGFLITSLIAPDVIAGTFSFSGFYKRRILRIFPALFAMFGVTAMLAFVYMLPSEFEDFSRSLGAAALSVSNIFFAQQSGYFDAPALTKPLLHTWSLGVEEQFYLVFPLFLVAAHRYFGSGLRMVLAFVAVASFAVGAIVSTHFTELAFYWTPFRLWELSLGALAALGFFPSLRSQLLRDVLGLVGLALIAMPVLFASSTTPWVIATLAPCIGAGLIIQIGESGTSVVTRLLSARPLVWIGLISYSLYLWHWPIMVFENSNSMIFGNSASYASKFGIVVISLIVATLSWALIERPFRKGYGGHSPRPIFAAAGLGMACAGLVAGAALASNGAAFRFPLSAVQISAYLDYKPDAAYRQDQCFIVGIADFDKATCLNQSSSQPNYLLIGDSHGAHLWYGLSSVFKSVNVMQATAAGCKPVVTAGGVLDAPGCSALMHYIFDDYLKRNKIDKIIIAAQWKPEDLPKIAATLDYLRSLSIPTVLVGPVVQYDYALPRLLADAIRYGNPRYPEQHRTAGLTALDSDMRSLAKEKGVAFISLLDAICPTGVCATYGANGVPLQFDYGHLTAEGSVLVAQRLSSGGVL